MIAVYFRIPHMYTGFPTLKFGNSIVLVVLNKFVSIGLRCSSKVVPSRLKGPCDFAGSSATFFDSSSRCQ